MPDPLMLAVVVTAIAIGWGLGRISRPSRSAESSGDLSATYHRGLNYLISEQPDRAVDTFIQVMDVTPDTLETHLSLGNLLRRRGEVDSAIRVHQNLLSRPSLPAGQQHKALLELARDYMKAGLLDRAGKLLQDLVEDSPEQRNIALRHLVEIFQEERDWHGALQAGEKLLPRRLLRQRSAAESTLAGAMAHYCCELAEQAEHDNDPREARRQIRRALGYDHRCVRAVLLQAHGLIAAGHHQQALKALHKVSAQNPVFIVECLDPIEHCYVALDDRPGFVSFLEQQIAVHPCSGLLLQLAVWVRRERSAEEAMKLLAAKLREQPSLRGVVDLVGLYREGVDRVTGSRLDVVAGLLTVQIDGIPAYRCIHCGFSGDQLHWQCPSCHHWGVVEPLAGLTGRQSVTARVAP